MSELTKLQKISALSKDLMNKKMNDTDRFVHLSHIHELAEDVQPELNENQQIVLDRLKEQVQSTEEKPFRTIFWLMNQAAWDRLSDLRNPIINLNKEQQIQVLRSYTDWLEQEAQR
ncbi:TPA: hypothetical protein OT179_001779 [Enterococcus faecalis]|nr:hypothetical protein [Enterococcus faecalis]